MENRIDLKIIEMLLMEGASNAINSHLFGHIPGSVGNTRFAAFYASIQVAVNSDILGDDYHMGQWRFPISDDQKGVGQLRMHNPHTRKFIKKLDILIELCVVDNTRREKWIRMIAFHQNAMSICGRHEDLNDNEILDYQREANYFFKEWVELHGEPGMTNYIHMVGSGHIGDSLLRWRNLYRHSQQGWEALNDLIKTFIHR